MYSIESFKKKVDMLHIELSDKQYNQYVTSEDCLSTSENHIIGFLEQEN